MTDHRSSAPAIVVTGGAMSPEGGPYAAGVEEAARAGLAVLVGGGSAISAVEAAIKLLEDNPIFNCGTGATLNLIGEVELDAAIMDGANLRYGGVGAVKRVRYPISLARKVMEETDHCLLVGPGAQSFAASVGYPDYDPVTVERRIRWEQERNSLKSRGEGKPGPRPAKGGTVGALALDLHGNIAAGSSTGGLLMKMPGRVGDSAIIGCGLYADNEAGAATTTGTGEAFIRHHGAKIAVDLLRSGQTPQEAAEATIRTIMEREAGAALAIITLDRRGRPGAARNVPTAPHTYLAADSQVPRINFGAFIIEER